jgi:hypothetical protein
VLSNVTPGSFLSLYTVTYFAFHFLMWLYT